MTLAQLVPLAINASTFLIVFALGLGTRGEDVAFLARHRALLFRSVLAMNVVMPLFVVIMLLLVPVAPPLRIALVALSLSPVPPILPRKQQKAGGQHSYTMSLLLAASVLALALVPAVLELLGRGLDRDLQMPFARVLQVLLVSVIAPLVLGVLLRRLLPNLATRTMKPVAVFGAVLLVVAFLLILIAQLPLIRALLGDGVLIALVLFSLVGLLVGHLLGGPEPENRSVLALATSTRHPGVAMAISAVNFPNEPAVSAVVLLHLIVGVVVTMPYVKLRRRARPEKLPPHGARPARA